MDRELKRILCCNIASDEHEEEIVIIKKDDFVRFAKQVVELYNENRKLIENNKLYNKIVIELLGEKDEQKQRRNQKAPGNSM